MGSAKYRFGVTYIHAPIRSRICGPAGIAAEKFLKLDPCFTVHHWVEIGSSCLRLSETPGYSNEPVWSKIEVADNPSSQRWCTFSVT